MKAGFVASYVGGNLRDFHQCKESRSRRLIETVQTGADKDAILANQGDDIGDGRERHQIEQAAQVVFESGAQIELAAALHQGVSEFEGQTGRAKFAKG